MRAWLGGTEAGGGVEVLHRLLLCFSRPIPTPPCFASTPPPALLLSLAVLVVLYPQADAAIAGSGILYPQAD